MNHYGSNPAPHYIHSSYNSLQEAGMSYPRNNNQHNAQHPCAPHHAPAPQVGVPQYPSGGQYPDMAYLSPNSEYERYMAIAGAVMAQGQQNHPGAAAPYPPGPPAQAPTPSPPKQCHHCKTTSTPLWRRDPTTGQPLCNACGLYLQQRHTYRPAELIQAEHEGASDRDGPAPQCNHCHTQETSVWRRDKDGNQVCNACGVYQRLRGVPRPAGLMQGKPMKSRAKHS